MLANTTSPLHTQVDGDDSNARRAYVGHSKTCMLEAPTATTVFYGITYTHGTE